MKNLMILSCSYASNIIVKSNDEAMGCIVLQHAFQAAISLFGKVDRKKNIKGVAWLSWNSRLTVLLGFKFFLLLVSAGPMVLAVKADVASNANLTPYEWEIEANDVLVFSFQLSVDGQDPIRALGYRTPLTVMLRVTSVPTFRESYTYDLSASTPSASVDVIEYRLGNYPYSSEQLFEISPLLAIGSEELFRYLPLALPIDFLDWATTQFTNGRTDRATEDGITSEIRVKYSATYFRLEQQFELAYENLATSEVLEFSRIDGVLNEYEVIETSNFDDGEAEYLGVTPGMHTIARRIERLQTQKIGYPHSQTPGFAFLLAILSFCLYGILKKRKKSSGRQY